MFAGICASEMMFSSTPPPPSPPLSPRVWLDGADASTFTLSGTDVESWANKGTDGGSFTPVAAPRCARISDGIRVPNVSPTATPTPFALHHTFGTTTQKIRTVFLVTSSVAIRTQPQTPFAMHLGYFAPAFNSHQEIQPETSFDRIRVRSRSQGIDSNINMLVSTPSVDWSSKMLISVKLGESTASIDVNNGEFNTSVSMHSYDVWANRMQIGASKPFSSTDYVELFDGNVHEVLEYFSELSAPDITAVQAYLSAKWGL